jgi:hypothetical protein
MVVTLVFHNGKLADVIFALSSETASGAKAGSQFLR